MDAAIRQRKGEPAYAPPAEEDLGVPQAMDEVVNETPRAAMSELSAAERSVDFREVELGFTKEVALAEACRCLRCDVKEVLE
jgi:NADH-quinone oxidoreductase subunit F